MKKERKGDQPTGSPGKSYRRQDEEARDREEQQKRAESTPASAPGDSTPIYLTGDSTLQTPEEHEHDRRIDPRKDNSMDVSDSDLEDIKAGRLTGRENPLESDETE